MLYIVVFNVNCASECKTDGCAGIMCSSVIWIFIAVNHEILHEVCIPSK